MCYNTHHIVVLNGELISKISIRHMKSHAEKRKMIYIYICSHDNKTLSYLQRDP